VTFNSEPAAEQIGLPMSFFGQSGIVSTAQNRTFVAATLNAGATYETEGWLASPSCCSPPFDVRNAYKRRTRSPVAFSPPLHRCGSCPGELALPILAAVGGVVVPATVEAPAHSDGRADGDAYRFRPQIWQSQERGVTTPPSSRSFAGGRHRLRQSNVPRQGVTNAEASWCGRRHTVGHSHSMG
jgi:hypothetical protein